MVFRPIPQVDFLDRRDWRMTQGGHSLVWVKAMKNLISGLSRVSRARSPGCGVQNSLTRWENLEGMAKCCSQWHFCIVFFVPTSGF